MPAPSQAPSVQDCTQAPTVAAAAAASDGDGIEATASAEDNRFLSMKHAIEKGCFDLKGVVGDMWYAELKELGSKVKEGYDAVGKSYKMQRQFRQDWVKGKYVIESKRRTKTTTSSQSEETWGSYEPFRVIVRNEGDDPEALKATMILLGHTVKYLAEGKLMGGKRPYVLWNEGTERFEYLWVKKGFRDMFTQSWSLTTTERDPDAEAAARVKLEPTEAGVAAKVAAAGTAPKAGAQVAKEKAAASKKRPRETTPDGSAAGLESTAKTNVGKIFTVLKTAHKEMKEAQASAADLKTIIETQPAWSWALKNKGMTDGLDQACGVFKMPG